MRLSLFFFLHLVAFVILIITHPHAKADVNGWTIIEKDKNFIYMSKNGEFIHGDRIVLSLNYKDCDTVYHLFTFLTTKGDANIYQFENKNIPIKINNFDFFAEVTHIEKILDHRAHWVVFKLGSYDSKEYAQKLSGFIEENERYEISLSDGLNFEVENYFDIRKNNWKLDYFSENFKEFYRRCNQKNKIKES